MERENKKINNLTQQGYFISRSKEVNPFSLAKYFYEKGIKDFAVIQKLIYLTFLEVLEEENIFLDFDEEWQAWPGSPVLEKVFSTMLEEWNKNRSYENLFSKVPSLNETDGLTSIDKEKIAKYCEKWARYFQKIEKKKQHYKLSEASRNQPWIVVRSKVSNQFGSRNNKFRWHY